MKVLLICSGGMSTSILIDALATQAKKAGINDFVAEAYGAHELEQHINDFDYVLVAPQIKHKYKTIEAAALAKGKKPYAIPPMEYTPIGAPNLFKAILKL